MLELNAKIRETLGKKVKSLRKEGIIPAVFYGPKTKSIPLEIDYSEFEKIYKEAGESTVVKLKVKDKEKKEEVKNVLIYDVAKNPVSDKFIHIDFYQVRMDKLITTEVSLVFKGESPVVEVEEGVLVKNITEVEVEALPVNLPREIEVDISILETFDDLIYIKDLKVSEGVKILAEPEEVVASVIPPRSEEELAALEEEVEEKVEEVEKVEEASTPEEVEKEPEKEKKEEEKQQ
jgi:large subunit ribosomal protein L25